MPKFEYKESIHNIIKIFKGHLEDLISPSERSLIRTNLKKSVDDISDRIYQAVVTATPPPRVENPDLFDYREAAWDKYEEQDYLHVKSAYPALRQYGMALRDGWQRPRIDFIGSNANTVQLRTSFDNIAPHAQMVLLGKYSKSAWFNPSDSSGMYGGRKVLMWQGADGKPRFRWMVVNNNTDYARKKGHRLTTGTGPLIRANPPLSAPINAAERIIDTARFNIRFDLANSIKDFFDKVT